MTTTETPQATDEQAEPTHEEMMAAWEWMKMVDQTEPDALSPLQILRRPFSPTHIGKLPRITCPKCRDSRYKSCDEHAKRQCRVCDNYMTPAHLHLDYVGHAEVTDRLLEADPEWSWEPLARDVDPALLAAATASANPDPELIRQIMEASPPKFERDDNGQPIGLWIKLTVAGVSRLGFGSVESRKFDAEKQLIGDALRNAAMRFGVALNLWSKGLLESETGADDGVAPNRQAGQPAEEPASAEAGPPFWRQYGYGDADEMQATNLGLKDVLDAIRPEYREPVRTWLIENGYVNIDEETGTQTPVPLPVKKQHVPEYRRVLIETRSASSQGAVAPPSQEAPQEAPEASAPDEGGQPDPEPAPAPQAAPQGAPSSVPADVVQQVTATVQAMQIPGLTEALREAGAPLTGNRQAKMDRLTLILLNRWSAENAA